MAGSKNTKSITRLRDGPAAAREVELWIQMKPGWQFVYDLDGHQYVYEWRETNHRQGLWFVREEATT